MTYPLKIADSSRGLSAIAELLVTLRRRNAILYTHLEEMATVCATVNNSVSSSQLTANRMYRQDMPVYCNGNL